MIFVVFTFVLSFQFFFKSSFTIKNIYSPNFTRVSVQRECNLKIHFTFKIVLKIYYLKTYQRRKSMLIKNINLAILRVKTMTHILTVNFFLKFSINCFNCLVSLFVQALHLFDIIPYLNSPSDLWLQLIICYYVLIA